MSENWTTLDLSDEPWSPPFKWGFNGETGEFTIWEVGGPGDGFPSHVDYLEEAWGRQPRPDVDTMGHVDIKDDAIELQASSGSGLPRELVAWATANFPEHRLITHGRLLDA